MNTNGKDQIAIIGMSGRFPQANNITELWQNLVEGKDCISRFTDEELLEEEIERAVFEKPNYVRAKGVFDNVEYFDPAFFGYTPLEAQMMDPQIRVFHECAWETLEDAGYNPFKYDGRISLFAGAAENITWKAKTMVASDPKNRSFSDSIYNSKDYLATRVAYNLNLRGPSSTVANACSTSLVTVHMACQSILNGECEMAMAGGSTVMLPNKSGYMYYDGLLFSKDGYIRTFDAGASGTVFSNGVGIVLMKPLDAAIRDKDNIYAVIKASAINNDGNRKGSFTAPSEEGQAELIKAALLKANVDPKTIGYVETHGTGTLLGDPVEVMGLQKAFDTDKRSFCALGSIKTNIGHLDAASGISGLIKAALVLKNKQIPASLHFNTPNPKIDFENSPFYVNTETIPWEKNGSPRRAGVNSFGVGGTNVHVILEEFESSPLTVPEDDKIVLLSAKTEHSLEGIKKSYADYINENKEVSIANMSYTTQVGREHFPMRNAVVASNTTELSGIINDKPELVKTGQATSGSMQMVFMFTGQGSQYVNMGWNLYQQEPSFKDSVDTCFSLLDEDLGKRLRAMLYPNTEAITQEKERIKQTQYTQPLLFIIEYAMAKLLMDWGIKPDALIGHSIGEYAAACIAGSVALKDALNLVVLRGKLMQSLPSGAMLSLPVNEAQAKILIQDTGVEIAAINSSNMVVVSGTHEEIESFANKLEESDIQYTKLHTSHAFHSKMMDPILADFQEEVKKVQFASPQIKFISNLTGEWITDKQLQSPVYWSEHLRNAVLFENGISTILDKGDTCFLEVGPGKALSTFIRQHKGNVSKSIVKNMIRHPKEMISDKRYLLSNLAELWCNGIEIDWIKFNQGREGKRISLPTYTFDRKKYWIKGDPFLKGTEVIHASMKMLKDPNLLNWMFLPQWKRSIAPNVNKLEAGSNILFFINSNQKGINNFKELSNNYNLTFVDIADQFDKVSEDTYTLNPYSEADYQSLFNSLRMTENLPDKIVHWWNVTDENTPADLKAVNDQQFVGCYSLLFIAKALDNEEVDKRVYIDTYSTYMQDVLDHEVIDPGKATLLALVKVISQEFENITCRSIDIDQYSEDGLKKLFTRSLNKEILCNPKDHVVAYRGQTRWEQDFQQLQVAEEQSTFSIDDGGTYIIFGGLGSIGKVWANYLTENAKVKLVLTGRSKMPDREEWDTILQEKKGEGSLCSKINAIRELENKGATVIPMAVDIQSKSQMDELTRFLIENKHQVAGIIHSAGVLNPDAFIPIVHSGLTEFEEHFAAKMEGLYHMRDMVKQVNPEFCVINSSTSSIICGVRYSAYSASNIFLDAFSKYQNQQGETKWLSINWDLWNTDSTQFVTSQSSGHEAGLDMEDISFSTDQGKQLLPYLLNHLSEKQVIVSISDMSSKVDYWIYNERVSKLKEAMIEVDNELDSRPVLESEYVEPMSETENQVKAIWSGMFGIKDIGIHDDFFDLGGDSIKAIGITSDITKKLKVNVPISEFFNTPTIQGVAAYIEANKVEEVKDKTRILPAKKQVSYPLSYAQQRLFIVNQMLGANITYNEPYIEYIYDRMDIPYFEGIIQRQIDRHEAFRTSFFIEDGVPCQRILPNVEFQVECFEAQEHEVDDIIRQFVRPFDLEKPPHIRAGVITLAANKHVLMVDMHHIISDGTSSKLFWKEHAAMTSGMKVPEIKLHMKDYAVWENSSEGQKMIQQQQKYWMDLYQEPVSELMLPYDFPRPDEISTAGKTFLFRVDNTLTQQLNDLAKLEGATLYMVMQSAFAVLLAKLSGQNDLVIGSITANRWHPDLNYVLGLFVNTLAIRSKPTADKTLRQFVNESKDIISGAYQNQMYPFDLLVKDLNIQQDATKNPLFNAEFTLQNFQAIEGAIPDKNVHQANNKVYNFDDATAKFDITLEAHEQQEGLLMKFIYKTALFKDETIKNLAEYYKKVLSEFVQQPDSKINDVRVLEIAESKGEDTFSNDLSDF